MLDKPGGLIRRSGVLSVEQLIIYDYLLEVARDELEYTKHKTSFSVDLEALEAFSLDAGWGKIDVIQAVNGIVMSCGAIDVFQKPWFYDKKEPCFKFMDPVSYDANKLHFSFSNEILRELIDPDVFAELDLGITSTFRSKYSLLLYENLKVHRFQRSIAYTLEVLRKLLGVESKYKSISELKRQVLLPSVDEINTKADIYINLGFLREGRNIIAATFNVKYK